MLIATKIVVNVKVIVRVKNNMITSSRMTRMRQQNLRRQEKKVSALSAQGRSATRRTKLVTAIGKMVRKVVMEIPTSATYDNPTTQGP